MGALGVPQSDVLVGPIREAFERSGLSVCEVARRVGCDEAYMRRIMGRAVGYSYRNGRRHAVNVRSVSFEMAEKLADALGVDPVEIGA